MSLLSETPVEIRERRIRKEGDDKIYCSVCRFWLSEGLLGLDPRTGEGGILLPNTTFAMSAFLLVNLGTFFWSSPAYFLFNPLKYSRHLMDIFRFSGVTKPRGRVQGNSTISKHVPVYYG